MKIDQILTMSLDNIIHRVESNSNKTVCGLKTNKSWVSKESYYTTDGDVCMNCNIIALKNDSINMNKQYSLN